MRIELPPSNRADRMGLSLAMGSRSKFATRLRIPGFGPPTAPSVKILSWTR